MEMTTTVEPEVGAVAPETADVSTSDNTEKVVEQNTESKPEEKKEEIPQISQTEEIQVYRNIIEKAEKDSNYKMTSDECDIFASVRGKINDGSLEDPMTTKPEESEKAEVKAEKKEETKEELSDEDKDKADEKSLEDLTDDEALSLQEAMTKVGAKDIRELPEKISGLIKKMRSVGGEKGSALKTYQEKEANHNAWMADLAAGKPAAIKHLKDITGLDFNSIKGTSQTKTKTTEESYDESDLNPDEFLDDKLAPIVISLRKQLEKQEKIIENLSSGEKARQEAFQRQSATTGWVDNIVDLVTEFPNDFKLTPKETRALATDYWSPDSYSKAVNPKFQAIHDLLMFANENGYPDVKSAHIIKQHQTGGYAQKLIAAKNEGQRNAQYKPSVNADLSHQQNKATNNIQNNLGENDVREMLAGKKAVPKEWKDENGTIIRSKVPQKLHEFLYK